MIFFQFWDNALKEGIKKSTFEINFISSSVWSKNISDLHKSFIFFNRLIFNM